MHILLILFGFLAAMCLGSRTDNSKFHKEMDEWLVNPQNKEGMNYKE